MTPRVALTIAGSDSAGGAGIQADLKTFAARGVFGATAITALTAQNTTGVRAVHAVPAGFVVEQVEAVLEHAARTMASDAIGMIRKRFMEVPFLRCRASSLGTALVVS